MKEIEEKALKAELDDIVKNIDAIMQRVEAALPAAEPAADKSSSETQSE